MGSPLRNDISPVPSGSEGRTHAFHDRGELAVVLVVEVFVGRLAQVGGLENAEAAEDFFGAEEREGLPPVGERGEVIEGGARGGEVPGDEAVVGQTEVGAAEAT